MYKLYKCFTIVKALWILYNPTFLQKDPIVLSMTTFLLNKRNQAFNKLEALRNDFKWEEYFERNDDKQSMAAYWKKRYQEASSQLAATSVRALHPIWALRAPTGARV